MCDLQVLQLMLGSGTKVVPCTLWSPTAEKYDNGIARAMEGVGFPAITLGMVERVTVCEVPKPVYKLQSTRATTVALRENQPLLIRPDPDLMLLNFRNLEDSNVANVMGIIAEVGDLHTSKQGQGMRRYELRDVAGLALSIVVHGDQAGDIHEVGSKVAFFPVVCQSPLQMDENDLGAGWCYSEALILSLGTSAIPALTGRVEIG